MKIWGQTTLNREKLKQAQNIFNCIVRKTKRESRQNLLEVMEESSDLAQIQLKDNNRCWIAF